MIIDSHCHLTYEPMVSSISETIKRAEKNGVNFFLTISTEDKSYNKILEIINKYKNVFGTYGIHPHEAKEAESAYLDTLKSYSNHKKVVAIGEIGLDYYYNFSEPDIQKKIFLNQLKLANDLNLPVVVHCREAYDDLYSTILKSKHTKGVIHCFSGDIDYAKKINKEKQVRNPKNNQILFKDKTYKIHFKIGKTLHKKLNHISSGDDK